MKHELRHPAFLCKDLDKGNVCPACPKARNYLMYDKFICKNIIHACAGFWKGSIIV